MQPINLAMAEMQQVLQKKLCISIQNLNWQSRTIQLYEVYIFQNNVNIIKLNNLTTNTINMYIVLFCWTAVLILSHTIPMLVSFVTSGFRQKFYMTLDTDRWYDQLD